MNRDEFVREVDALGVRRESYSLDGGVHNDKYVLSPEPMGRWAVYYSERGLIFGKEDFDDQDKAYQYLKEIIISDKTIGLKDIHE
ncbi:MAG: hypothetical protein ACLGPL_02270 [Acidobacteriota bacterium]